MGPVPAASFVPARVHEASEYGPVAAELRYHADSYVVRVFRHLLALRHVAERLVQPVPESASRETVEFRESGVPYP